MDVTVQAADLAGLIGRMKATKSTRQPWFAGLATRDENTIYVSSVGFYSSSEAHCAAAVSAFGEVVIPLPKLEAWLGGVDGEVELSLEDGLVHCSADNAELTLPTVPDAVPVLPPEPSEALALPRAVWDAIPRVAWAADRLGDAPPSWRNMIHVRPGMAFATNDKVFATVAVEGCETEVALFPDVVALARTLDHDTLVTTRDEAGRLHLRDNGGRYVVSTFAGESRLPIANPVAVAKERAPKRLHLSTLALGDAVDHLRKLKATDSTRIVVDPTEGMPLLSVETDDGYPATRDVPFMAVGELEPMGLNVDHLSALLDRLDEDDVTFQVGDQRTPLVVEEGALAVLLPPMQLSAKARVAKKRAKAKAAA